ncbi:MAG: ADP-dependent glucokinase/phosphofructokinase [Candidatus Bathyarchaeia archaeon]
MLRADDIEEEMGEIYRDAIRDMSTAIGKFDSVITAFNTNIDAVHFLSSQELKEVLSQSNSEDLRKKIWNPENRIIQKEDFLSGLLLSMKTGIGMEWIIRNRKVFDWIQKNFPVNEYRMGGFAGIVANTLARLGVKEVYPHVASLPELQARLFINDGRIKIPVEDDGGLQFKNPLEAIRHGDDPLIHWIFEYDEGVKAEVNGGIVAPQANRFIATWDERNTRLHIDKGFLRGTREIIENVNLALISGYHMMVKSEDFSERSCLKKIGFTRKLLGEWKEAGDVKVHLELAHFTDLDVLKAVLVYLSDVVDGIGLNESELAQCVSCLGERELSRAIVEESKIETFLEGLFYLVRRLDIGKIVVHTRDFCIAMSRKPVEKNLLSAVAAGNCVAIAKAATGRLSNLEEIRKILRERKIHWSSKGLSGFHMFTDKLKKMGYQLLDDFSFDVDNYVIWFMPMRVIERPASTVGLGDCFAAGYSLLAY